MHDLIDLYMKLRAPVGEGGLDTFTALPILGLPHRIGRGANGVPALLVAASITPKASPIRLEHLDVRHGVTCRITHPDHSFETGTFSVIRCLGAESELVRCFLRVLEPIVRSLGPAPSPEVLTRTIEDLVELFRAMEQPPQKSAHGLFAELCVICCAVDPTKLLRAWHVAPEERFDFSDGAQRIEVKASASRVREHHFSLEQVSPPLGCRVLVASTFVDHAGGGVSIEDLVGQVCSLVGEEPELQARLNRGVARSLGSNWRDSTSVRFDFEVTRTSIVFFDVETVPRVALPLPWGVSEVRFKSDLSQCEPVMFEILRERGGIFAAAEPRR